jgi:exosortase/archaeosortase family protein
LLSWFFLQPPSLSAHLAIFIWIFTALVVFYLLKRRDFGKTLKKWEINAVIALGVFFCILSFFFVQVGLGNPPYSIDDFSILLSGLTLIFFAVVGFRRLLFASAIPLVAVVTFQVYDKVRLALETLAEPLIPPVVHLSIFFLNLLGVGARADGNMIVFNTVQGSPIFVPIVFDCTGVESMATFLLAAAVVFYLFRDMVLRKKLVFLAIGVIGTYIANIMRVVAICLSGYYYGPKGAIELTHIHAGWIIFTIWMFIFWYAFFISYMKGLKGRQKTQRKRPRGKGKV